MDDRIAALYVRVSTQEQAKEGYSIDEQIDRLKKYADAMGWAYKVYVDAGFSGGSTNRPDLQAMIADIKRGLINRVCVYKLDRLSRSQKDTLELIEDVFLAAHCDFVSMSENFDTSTPFGKAMIGILAVFAQLEREQIKERMSMGREGRAKDGQWMGGGTDPIGYDYKDGRLIVNEFEAMQIRELHSLYQSGHSFYEIERIFADKGYKHKHGLWTSRRLKAVALNDLYCGRIHFNGKTFEGEHPAIIDADTLDKTIALYKSHDYSKAANNGHVSYLAGMLFCARCGSRYITSTYHRTYKGKTSEYRYYACHSRRKRNAAMVKDPSCKNKTYRVDELDNLIFGEVKKLALDPSLLDDAPSGTDDKEKALQDEIAKIDAQRARLLDLYAIGQYTIAELQDKVSELNAQKARLGSELQSLTADKGITKASARRMVNTLADALETGTRDEIRALLKALIDFVEIDGDDITIHWAF